MSLADDNDAFAALIGQLDLSVPEDVVDFTSLATVELSGRLSVVKQRLLELGEMLRPRSAEATRLHSERDAIMVILNKRGLA